MVGASALLCSAGFDGAAKMKQSRSADDGGPMSTDRDAEALHAAEKEEDPPPFLRTWKRLYAAIVFYTGVLILALYLMTVALNR